MIIKRKTRKKILIAALLLIAGGLYWGIAGGRIPWIKGGIRLEAPESVSEEEETPEEAPAPEPEEISPEEPSLMAVHVSGAVQEPDRLIYLEEGSRVADAVEACGGLSEDADLTRVNLAGPVSDGQKIYIPREGESEEEVREHTLPATGSASTAGDQKQDLTNLNTASKIELIALPGIGEVYAQRIIDYREQNGGFAAIEEIMQVKGIGEAVFHKIKDKITV